MNEKLQKQWYLLAYLFIAHVLLFGAYRLLKATAILNLATLKILLFWPCLILIFFVLFFSVFLYRKSGDDWKRYVHDKKFVRLFFFAGFGLAILFAVMTDYII